MKAYSNFSTRLLTIFCVLNASFLLFVSCGTHVGVALGEVLPKEPAYSDSTQWYITNRGAEADVFYIISTETGDYLAKNGRGICHYADTYADSLRAPMLGEMIGVDRLISGKLNYYSPYYRQCSIQSYTLGDSVARARMIVPTEDIKRAFAYYVNNLNAGRPFVLAGYSQGAMILLELLREMDAKTYKRMVGAYAIGATVSAEMLRESRYIVPAKGADDTGVTILYNSVRDTTCALPILGRSVLAINPVNWRTDTTPATLITEPSPLRLGVKQDKDTLTVTLDPTTKLLLVKGYRGKDYVTPLIGKEGNLHSREIWLYRNCLRENIALRTARLSRRK